VLIDQEEKLLALSVKRSVCVYTCVCNGVCVHEGFDHHMSSLHTCCVFHSSVIVIDIGDTSDIALREARRKRKEQEVMD